MDFTISCKRHQIFLDICNKSHGVFAFGVFFFRAGLKDVVCQYSI